jgi:hypothetical protein
MATSWMNLMDKVNSKHETFGGMNFYFEKTWEQAE